MSTLTTTAERAEGKVKKSPRSLPIDALRGLIILFMALDHANHFVAHKHSSGEYWTGGFPVYTDTLAFLTRLVTHLAPVGFFFLMGVGMILFAKSRRERGWTTGEIIRHFWIRGAVLIALQLLIVNRAWELSPEGWGVEIYIGVLVALGGTMIVGSLLLWLSPKILIGLTLLLAVGMDLVVPDPNLGDVGISTLGHLLAISGGNADFWVNYPVFAWLELVTLGMVFGHLLVKSPTKAFRGMLYTGVAFLLAFAVIRYLDGFGNLRPRMGNTWIDFLNPVKYPPSITFNLMAMGVNFIILWSFSLIAEKVKTLLQVLAVYGQAPLFFYVLHLYVYAGLGLWLTPEGSSIPSMYPYWLFGLLLLFPITLWFGVYKRGQSTRSLLRFV
jgi:uncharacterized membrane protein